MPISYNIAPSQKVLTIRFNPETRVRSLNALQWGLIPYWAKDPKVGYRNINARAETIDKAPEGKFGSRIAGLDADIVIDMISFELEGTQQLVQALHGKVEHYLFCSSIWVYGHAVSIPFTEVDRPNAIDTYWAKRRRSKLGSCSRLGGMAPLRHASGRVTSLAAKMLTCPRC